MLGHEFRNSTSDLVALYEGGRLGRAQMIALRSPRPICGSAVALLILAVLAIPVLPARASDDFLSSAERRMDSTDIEEQTPVQVLAFPMVSAFNVNPFFLLSKFDNTVSEPGRPGELPVVRLVSESPTFMRALALRAPLDMVAGDGAVGRNREAFSDVAAQRDVIWLVLRGLAENDPAAIDASIRALEYAFRYQTPAGNFENGRGVSAVRAVGVDAFFIQGFARMQLLIRQSPFAEQFAPRFDAMNPGLARALKWLQANKKELYRQDRKATNRLFFDALALTLGGYIAGDRGAIKLGYEFIEAGLANQREDGTFNEHDGFDSSYQAVSLLNIGGLLAHIQDADGKARLTDAFVRGYKWERGRIAKDGEVLVEGNSRTGLGQEEFLGRPKDVNYAEVALSFFYAAHILQDQEAQKTGKTIVDYILSKQAP